LEGGGVGGWRRGGEEERSRREKMMGPIVATAIPTRTPRSALPSMLPLHSEHKQPGGNTENREAH